jgi:hypothetical protein
MKILLITTGQNKNPGDQFIRLGVEQVIRAVWPAGQLPPELIRVDKESDDIGAEREFDRAILCGMPLWWNNRVSKSQDIGWWGPLVRGWISAERRKFLVLGAGPVVGSEGILDSVEFRDAVEETCERAWAVTTRQFLPHLLPMDCPMPQESICPAAFAVQHADHRWRRLVNLMPDGAHDSHFDEAAAAEWRRRLPDIAASLQGSFDFVAHRPDEVALAQVLGWTSDRIHYCQTPEALLRLYAETKTFFGNRLHGAMAAAVSGAVSCAVGYDSRLEMLAPFTPNRWGPFGVPTPLTPAFLDTLPVGVQRERLAREWSFHCDLVRRFLFDS